MLETLLETEPGLVRLAQEAGGGGQDLAPDCREGAEKSEEEREEEALMLETLLQRVQATLLAIYRLQAARVPKKGKESTGEGAAAPGLLVKNLYAESLKMGEKSAGNILLLLREISKQMGHLRG